jgi:antitoxin FitA
VTTAGACGDAGVPTAGTPDLGYEETTNTPLWPPARSGPDRDGISFRRDDLPHGMATWHRECSSRTAGDGAKMALEWAVVPSIQIKDVPDDVHAIVRQRAAAAGKSLQEYLLARLLEDARTPTLDEVLDRAGGRAGGRAGLKSATKAVRIERDSR